MAEQASLADMAVRALADVAAIDSSVTIEAPERHIVRELKRQAESTIQEACIRAMGLARLAADIQETYSEARHG